MKLLLIFLTLATTLKAQDFKNAKWQEWTTKDSNVSVYYGFGDILPHGPLLTKIYQYGQDSIKIALYEIRKPVILCDTLCHGKVQFIQDHDKRYINTIYKNGFIVIKDKEFMSFLNNGTGEKFYLRIEQIDFVKINSTLYNFKYRAELITH